MTFSTQTIAPGSHASSFSETCSNWLCRMARLGYASRGVVYIAVGVLAVLAALGNGNGETTGPRGALSYIRGGPFGGLMLGVVGVGLFSFAAWRFLQAALNLDHADSDAKGYIKRGSMIVSGIVHLTLGIWVATALFASGGGSSDDEGSHRWTAWLLDKPGGHWLVAAIGGIIIAAGVAQIIKGWKAKFEKRLSLDYDRLPWMRTVCRFGLIARGVVFIMIGGLFIRAAVNRAPGQSGGVATVLRELQNQPWGWILLGVAALGLVAFGIYGLVEARYRRINI